MWVRFPPGAHVMDKESKSLGIIFIDLTPDTVVMSEVFYNPTGHTYLPMAEWPSTGCKVLRHIKNFYSDIEPKTIVGTIDHAIEDANQRLRLSTSCPVDLRRYYPELGTHYWDNS